MAVDVLKARKFNTRQGFSVEQVRVIAGAVGVHEALLSAWTAETLAKVAAWQVAHGLEGDGMVGPKTLAKMTASEEGVEGAGVLPYNLADCVRQFPKLIFGIDKSIYQQLFEAHKVKAAGCRFVMHRASYHTGIDAVVEGHAKLALDVGLKNGFYHVPQNVKGEDWEHMTPTDPEVYARFAAGLVGRLGAAPLGHWLDLEPDSEEKKPKRFSALVKAVGRVKAAAWVARWLEVFEGLTGLVAGVYFSPRLAREGGMELRRVIGERRTWWALYLADPPWPRPWPPGLVEGWGDGEGAGIEGEGDLWQFRADDRPPKIRGGRCPGVDGGLGACDLNVLNPASALASLFG